MLHASLCAKIMVFRRITRIIGIVLNERTVEEIYKISSFKAIYNAIDKDALLEWENQKQYEILRLLYPQLEVPDIRIKGKTVSLLE